ncbi:MAG: type IV pilus biogenesis protein PilM [Cyanophyceae cyanobacterium]
MIANLFKRSSSKSLLGIDINSERIAVAQLKKQGNRTILQHYVTAEMPIGAMVEGRIQDPMSLGLTLSNLLSENNISGEGGVATAVPVRDAIVRLIRLPADLPADELRRVVLEQEAELYIPFDREMADVDFQALGLDIGDDNIERTEVLLVAIPKEVVDSQLEVLRAANLKPRCVELTSFSIIRTIQEQLSQYGSQDAVLLTSIGYESSEISILVNGVPQFTRTVNTGTTHMQQVLAQALNLPSGRTGDLLMSLRLPVVNPNETLVMGEQGANNPGITAVSRILGDLADELQRSVDFYVSQERSCPVVKVLLAGSGAGMSQIDGFLSQRIGIPVELADPLGSLSVPDNIDIPLNERPSLGVALGLGMRNS